MKTLMAEYDAVIIFAILALLKGLTEIYAYKHVNPQGGEQSSRLISRYLVVMGALTPILILAEITIWEHRIPLPLAIPCAVAYLFVLALRVISIRTLGEFYSVNIRIMEDHQLVDWGIYRYLRHPIYLVVILENVLYPLASSAYYAAIILTVLVTPPILYRRHEEEGVLLETFGKSFLAYKKQTWF